MTFSEACKVAILVIQIIMLGVTLRFVQAREYGEDTPSFSFTFHTVSVLVLITVMLAIMPSLW